MRKFLILLVALLSLVTANAQVPEADATLAKQIVAKNLGGAGMTAADLENSLVSATYVSPDGIRMVYLQQSHLGIPVYNELKVLAFRNEKLVSASGSRIAGIEKKVNSQSGVPTQDVKSAVMAAFAESKITAKLPIIVQGEKNGRLNFGKLGATYEDVTARLLWIPMENKEVKLAWQVAVAPDKSDDMWLVRVDAFNNEILGKDNLTVFDNWHKEGVSVLRSDIPTPQTQTRTWIQRSAEGESATPIVNGASYLVIKYPAESPSHPGGTAQTHTDPWTMATGNAVALKWHSNGPTNYNISRGNNVWATEDRAAANQNTGLPATSSTPDPLTFNFPPDYTVIPTNAAFQQFAITNLFYWNNIIHDITYLYGFNEAAGNFQQNNQGLGGLGSDDVMALAQSGAGNNNANFLTPDDGTRGRMRMYLWTAPNPDRDGDLDNGIVTHEFGHGVSNRFTGGPANSSCLQNAEQAGEGWSDYLGLMLTTNWATASPGDGVIGRGIGTYALGQPPTGVGIRVFRYSTDLSINPRVYSVNLPSAPHDRGEYWCAALWEMTWEMIQLDGINPNLYNPTATGGNSAALKLVLEGMRLQPCSPGFIDARNAILAADTLLYGAHYSCAIWKAFAKRGMGRNASQGSSNSVTDQVPSFIVDNGVFKENTSAPAIEEGLNVTYTNVVTAGNCSPMNNYFITDTLPTHVTYVSGGTYNAGNRTITMGPVNLTSGQSQSFPFTVNINAGSYFPPVTHFNEQVAGATIPAAWTPTPASGNAWAVSNIQSQSPPNSFFAVDPTVAVDMMLATTSAFNLSPTGASSYSTLSFWHKFNTEDGWDGGVVEVSTNGGASWTDLGSRMISGKYNGSLGAGVGNNLANRQAFTGNSGAGFMKTVVNLTSYTGQAINIRFRFASDDNTAPTGGGWWVDDIVLTTEPAVYMKSNLFNSSSQLQSVTDTITKILPPVVGCTNVAITTQPVNANACSGSNATFTVVATGTSPVYQWQENTGSGFVNISPAAGYSGINTATLTLNAVTVSMTGYQYRVVISNSCPSSVTSIAVALTVGVTATLQAHPSGSTVCVGQNTTFSVTATDATSYQWQVNTGTGFTNVPAAAPYSGTTTATLTITGATSGMNTYQYRVIVGSCPSNINSNAATLTVNDPVSFTQQPAAASVCEGLTANFSITAAGTITGYQWQVSINGGSTWTNIPGATTTALSIPNVTLAMSGSLYRNVVTGVCGVVNSGTAALTVNPTPSFTLGAIPATVCISDAPITLTASVGGGVWSGPGVTGNQFTPLAAGTGTKTVTYTVTNASGCTKALSTQIVVSECAERHVELDKPNSIIVYSNPNNGRFNIWIKTDLYTKLGMRVYNAAGQLVREQNFSGVFYDKKIYVDMAKLQAGVYQLLFFNDETGKMVKKTIGIVISH